VLAALLILPLVPHPAQARSFIRDAEVEHTLRTMTAPILEAAELNPDDVRLFIVNDDSINAYVAGGLNIFIHTGLILNSQNPHMLMGVVAHETGHIAGAHLALLSGASEQASVGALLSMVLGAAAAIGGSGDAAAAIMTGGQSAAMRNLLSHYRGNEQQADQAGIRFMRAAGLSPKGMLDMFEVLRRNEQQHGGNQDPYLRTHPLTKERIAVLRSAVMGAETTGELPESTQVAYARTIAKLYAFLEPPEKTFARYPKDATDEPSLLAHAVAYFRTPDLPKALASVDRLIAKNPKDAFAYDLKGQILFEHGKIQDAITAYTKAEELEPKNALILSDLGRSHLALNSPQAYEKAAQLLQEATAIDPTHSASFHHLGEAYGKKGEMGKSYLAFAQESLLINNPKDALQYAKLAKDQLKSDSMQTLTADDIIADAQRLLKEQKKATP